MPRSPAACERPLRGATPSAASLPARVAREQAGASAAATVHVQANAAQRYADWTIRRIRVAIAAQTYSTVGRCPVDGDTRVPARKVGPWRQEKERTMAGIARPLSRCIARRQSVRASREARGALIFAERALLRSRTPERHRGAAVAGRCVCGRRVGRSAWLGHLAHALARMRARSRSRRPGANVGPSRSSSAMKLSTSSASSWPSRRRCRSSAIASSGAHRRTVACALGHRVVGGADREDPRGAAGSRLPISPAG